VEGKRVAVVAPAGVPDMDNLAQAICLLESWGLSVSVGATWLTGSGISRDPISIAQTICLRR